MLQPVLGQAVFGPQEILYDSNGVVEFIETADLDMDGYSDVLVVWEFGFGWHRNLDGGGLGPYQSIDSTAGCSRSLVLIDLNGDGLVDPVLAKYCSNSIVAYPNMGGGLFGVPFELATGISYPRALAFGDIDGDGDQDLVTHSSSQLVWLRNPGSLDSFSVVQIRFPSPMGVRDIVVEDFNDDGLADVMVALSYKLIYHANLGGFFGPAVVKSYNGGPSIVSGDLDGDSTPDIIIGTDDYSKYLAGYLNTSTEPFGSAYVVDTECKLGWSSGRQSIALGDWDNDGDLEAMMTEPYERAIRYYDNSGNGPGKEGQRTTLTRDLHTVRSLLPIDIDGDGDLDLLAATANYSIFGHTGKLAWFENRCTTTFPPQNPSLLLGTDSLHFAWDPVEGTQACQLRGTRLDGVVDERRIETFGSALASYSTAIPRLAPGSQWAWAIRCACHTDRVIPQTPRVRATPYAPIDTIVIPVLRSTTENMTMRLSANPSSGEAALYWQSSFGETMQVRVVDMQGRTRYQAENVAGPGEQRMTLPALPQGTYIIHMEAPDQANQFLHWVVLD